MKMCKIVNFVVLCVVVMIAAAGLSAQTVEIPLEDLQQLRKLAADRDHWKGVADDRGQQIEGLKASVNNWAGLYSSEKRRADEIQESRVAAVKDAVSELQKANFELRNLNDDLKNENKDLERDNIRLRASRKYYLFGGMAIGGTAGAVVGYQLGQSGGLPLIPGARPANRGVGFGFRF